MHKYLKILDNVLNGLRRLMPKNKTNNLQDIDLMIQLSKLSNDILLSFIEFLEGDSTTKTINNYLIVMQQLKSRLISNERAVKILEEFEDKLYMDEMNEEDE